MPNYTYTGMDPSITLRGVTFPAGEAVEIDDPAFESKLDALPYFSSDKPEPVQKEESSDSAEIAGLKRKISGLEAENATLRRQLAEALEGSEPEAEVEPITAIEEEPELEMVDPGTPDEEVEIPEDWETLHWKQRLVIAKNFTDMDIANGDDADTVIRMELEARANA